MTRPATPQELAVARKPTRTIHDLSDNERTIIRKRNRGWESASPGLLALVFCVPVQAINVVLREG